jgi:hypothetical protein
MVRRVGMISKHFKSAHLVTHIGLLKERKILIFFLPLFSLYIFSRDLLVDSRGIKGSDCIFSVIKQNLHVFLRRGFFKSPFNKKSTELLKSTYTVSTAAPLC